mmetsp:Transcript_16528/g.18381  ORF Transcript_16528/g.18381 Transcript_16528/m.18381 type:complete len:122 (+) Transcript_16528:12-377(+)
MVMSKVNKIFTYFTLFISLMIVFVNGSNKTKSEFISSDISHEVEPFFFEKWIEDGSVYFDSLFLYFGFENIPFLLKYLAWSYIIMLPIGIIIVGYYRIFVIPQVRKERAEKEMKQTKNKKK